MTTTQPVMNWQAINELANASDTVTMATALRNIILVTDKATEDAQSAANARQEYVPTVLHKDALYRALDAALRSESYDPRDHGQVLADDEGEDPYQPENTPNKALARALFWAHEWWDRYVDSDDFDEDTDQFVWIADEVTRMVAADEAARAQPTEKRGTIVVPRTAPAIKAALIEHSPEDLDRFETEFHTAMAEADDDFDLSRVSLVISRWWGRAMVRANPDPKAEAVWERIKAGDEIDLAIERRRRPDGSIFVYRKDETGGWVYSHTIPPGLVL